MKPDGETTDELTKITLTQRYPRRDSAKRDAERERERKRERERRIKRE